MHMPHSIINYFKIGNQPGRIPELDGVRALAIILVLLYHYAVYYKEVFGSYYRGFFSESAQWLMQNGWLGVDLFFVLSGYLITHHLMQHADRIKEKTFIAQYALKRVLRTFPLFYAVMFLIMLDWVPFYSRSNDATDFWIHVFFLQDYFGSNFLIPMWSLATEEKFYLLAPLLFLFIKPEQYRKAACGLLIFTLLAFVIKSLLMNNDTTLNHYDSYFYVYRAPFHYALWSILVGVAVALFKPSKVAQQSPLLVFVCLAVLGILITQFDLFKPENWAWANLLHLIIVLLFGLLVWACIQASGNRALSVMRSRVLRIIAILSYALYLGHYLVLSGVTRWVKDNIRSETAWEHALSFMGIYLLAAFLLALLLHYIFEKPFLRLKDKVGS